MPAQLQNDRAFSEISNSCGGRQLHPLVRFESSRGVIVAGGSLEFLPSRSVARELGPTRVVKHLSDVMQDDDMRMSHGTGIHSL